jgi:hypothetical protein
MSGPVTTEDASPTSARNEPPTAAVEITDSRQAQVGALSVRRALPRRGRRTVGAWCFVDHMGPATLSPVRGLDVAPHPHIGLQTVTWLLAGEAVHRDSLGSEQVIRPGHLNLMTAGRGVSHSEEGTGHFAGQLHGVQLWIAQPSATREGSPAFEHHAELSQVDLDGAVATVLVGAFAGRRSTARRDTDHVGVDLDLHDATTTLPLRNDYEYGLVVFDGSVRIGEQPVEPGHLAYLGRGRDELELATTGRTRALLFGGTPFEEPILMWWNFVARSQDEITQAQREWATGGERFGHVASSLPRVETGPPPWTLHRP